VREPFRARHQLLINEFGTALDGNAENLNAAIRSGAPALQQLKQVLNILGQQNTTIAELNTNADTIFQQLANRKEDVVHFIDNAGRTAAISAERSSDLSQNFHLLDDFLAQLKPTMFQLGNLAEQQTPLLTDLHAAAPGLNKLATNLPSFNSGTEQSLTSLGGAAHVGKTALANSQDEIASLDQASTKAYPAADQVAQFLESISDPKNAVEEDACARYDLRQQPGQADQRVQQLDTKLGTTLHGDQTAQCKWSNGTPPGSNASGGNPGYTGMEGLLNYGYVQANSLNLFDQLGHALGITLVSAPGANNACGYQTGPAVPDLQGSSGNTGTTTDPKNFAECAGILGDKQPGINYGTNSSGLFGNLGRYDPSVCPDGSAVLSICNPADTPHTKAGLQSATTAPPAPKQHAATPEQQKQIQKILNGTDPNKLPDDAKKKLQNLLPGVPLPDVPQLPQLGGTGANSTAPSGSTTQDLLNFLLGQ
jgi:ABC-type transporter Mla subunit MlaD